jgi:hypothetical protein
MERYKKEFIFYGDDIKIERFPRDTRFIYANPPMTPLPDFKQAVGQALDNPLDAQPLEKQLKSSSRVVIAFDDPCVPVPIMRGDVRAPMIETLLRRLFAMGIGKDRIRLICANGLHRKWTLDELALLLGKNVISEIGPERISCHDGTREEELAFLGSTPDGHEVEINRAVTESDVTIYVNVNYTSMNGGWKSVPVGLGSWRSIRHHHTPREWNLDASVMNPHTNPMHGILKDMGVLVRKNANIFQMECVLDNNIWTPARKRFLTPINHPARQTPPGFGSRALLTAMAAAPDRLKVRMRHGLRANYAPIAVSAGDVDAVHRRTLETLAKQQEVHVNYEPASILVLGVPNISPYSCLSVFNPILLRSLALGYMLGSFQRRPLLKKGGVVVVYNPGKAVFHPRHHPSYIDFWNNDLDDYYEPETCWDELAESYAQNPVYLRKYRDEYAYHGTHCLMNWAWSGMSFKYAGDVILAGATEPHTARKIGFIPATDFDTALAMARERVGEGASAAYPFPTPLFCVG